MLKKELANFDKIEEVTAESIQAEVFKPKDEISSEIMKQQIKCEAY